MSETIRFLRPRLPTADEILPLLRDIDASGLYSNHGPLCVAFEERVLEEGFGGEGGFCTVANATVGLMLALRQQRRAGRYAVMPSFTFAATPLAAEWAGLEPYFVDVDRERWCLDPERLEEALGALGNEVAVVVPYATFGTALDLAPYARLLERGIPVVVDAAASFGTRVEGTPWGRGFGGPVVFSFHATKSFGIGEGGGVYSGDAEVVARLRRGTNFGFGPDRAAADCGLNGKLSEFGAAVALTLWERYPAKAAERRRVYASYVDALASRGHLDRGWRLQEVSGEVPAQVASVLCPPGSSRDGIAARLAASGVESRTYFSPACHQQPWFASAGRGPLPVTEELAARVLNLPLWEGLDPSTVDRVVGALES